MYNYQDYVLVVLMCVVVVSRENYEIFDLGPWSEAEMGISLQKYIGFDNSGVFVHILGRTKSNFD